MISYIASEQNLTININGRHRIINIKSKDHRNYLIRLVTACQKEESEENLEELEIALTPYKKIQHQVDNRIEYIEDLGKLFVRGIERPLPPVLQNKIMGFLEDNLPIDALIKFWENCQDNPEFRAVEELYLFLEHNGLPITDDGCFIAYKKVDRVSIEATVPGEFIGLYFDKAGNCRKANGHFVGKDIKDSFKQWLENSNKEFKLVDNYTKTMDNSVGQIVSMQRQAVDNDRNRTCSKGLHFASWNYASTYSGNTLIMVKINPKDVVAIPADYNNQKGRACQYEVIGIIGEELQVKHFEYNH